MQPVRLKSRIGAPVPGQGATGDNASSPPVKPRGRGPSRYGRFRRVFLILLAIVGLAWGGVATYLLLQERAAVAMLRQEQLFLQTSYEERVRALTRRLVGAIASQQAPGQMSGQISGKEGTDDQLADLITRQVELETRQNLLGGLTGQAIAPVLPGGGAQAQPGGATQFAGRDNILDRLDPALAAPQRRQIAALLRANEALPLSERIAILGQSLDRVDIEQNRQISALGMRLVARVQEIRTALTDLGLDVARVRLPAPRQATGGPLIPLSVAMRPGSFEHKLLQLNEGQSVYGRWRDLANIVPLRRPLEGDDSTTSNFGPRIDPFTGANAMHAGMDFRAETGTPVLATGAGKVLRTEVSGGYGNLIEIDHGNGLTTRYGHLSAFEVKPDQIVGPGAMIGRVGSTGRSTGPHLHYETRLSDEARNPLKFIEIGTKLSQPAVGGSR